MGPGADQPPAAAPLGSSAADNRTHGGSPLPGSEHTGGSAGLFAPDRVRQKSIPKANGKLRWLRIPTMADRVVQASLKLVLEPIFDADFQPSSYGFRPRRRAQDAIAEIHYRGSAIRDYGWVFEADITACFDEINHQALLDRMRRRISDKKVLGVVKAFLKAGVLTEDGLNRDTRTGTPQGGILSPLLANIALSVLDEHFHAKWKALGPEWSRVKHRRAGGGPGYEARPLRRRLRDLGPRPTVRCRGVVG